MQNASHTIAVIGHAKGIKTVLTKKDRLHITTASIESSMLLMNKDNSVHLHFFSEKFNECGEKQGNFGMHTIVAEEWSLIDSDELWSDWLWTIRLSEHLALRTNQDGRMFAMTTRTEQFIDEDTGEVVDATLTICVAVDGSPIKPVALDIYKCDISTLDFIDNTIVLNCLTKNKISKNGL
jgi:hypothetical protein